MSSTESPEALSGSEDAAAPPPRGLLRLTAPWWGLALALALGSAVVALATWWGGPRFHDVFDWQHAQLAAQPWRWWSAALAHLDARHLAANLAGCAVVAAFGIAAGLGRAAALAWCLAWPLTHLALALAPGVERHAGLSGVLHAGVAVAAVFTLARPVHGQQRWVGAAMAAGLLAKLAWERPWAMPVQRVAGWDFPVVVAAHASGAAAGAACALLVLGWRRAARPRMPG